MPGWIWTTPSYLCRSKMNMFLQDTPLSSSCFRSILWDSAAWQIILKLAGKLTSRFLQKVGLEASLTSSLRVVILDFLIVFWCLFLKSPSPWPLTFCDLYICGEATKLNASFFCGLKGGMARLRRAFRSVVTNLDLKIGNNRYFTTRILAQSSQLP